MLCVCVDGQPRASVGRDWGGPALADHADPPIHVHAILQSALQKDGSMEIQFKVVPNDDMAITFDAPWQLTFKDHPGLKAEKKSFGVKELDQKLPGFAVKVQPEANSGDLKYKLIAFICTKDKTRCYREVHDTSMAWKK